MSNSSLPQEPLYRRVKLDLQRQILSGDVKVGDWLPSESELQRRYGVSLTPVRRALQELEQAGLIARLHGRGSVVRSTRIASLHGMIGFSRELASRGHEVQPRTLSVEERPATEAEATPLGVALGEPIVAIRRLFVVDGAPLAVFDHHLRRVAPIDRLRAAGDFRSLYDLLRENGLEVAEARELVEAIMLDAEDARLLEVESGLPALLRRRTATTSDGVPVEHTVYRIRSDRYAMEIDLRSGRP